MVFHPARFSRQRRPTGYSIGVPLRGKKLKNEK
jgi:hypothetical protein